MPDYLDPRLPTVTRLLQSDGYVTGHYGKWHLESLEYGGEGALPDDYGFDEWRVSETADWYLWDRSLRPRSSKMIIDETIGFIERHKEQPFYVQAWLLDTHGSLNPTQQQLKIYEDLSPVAYGNPFLIDKPSFLAEDPLPFPGPAQIYYSAVTDADKQVGRLLRKLDELGLAENTIVIFSSDNGPEDILSGDARHHAVGSPGPFRGRKRSLYEGGVRVPFIVRWPAATPAGRVNNTSVISAVDFLPTLCALAGIRLPRVLALDGENVSAAFEGQAKIRTKPLMWEWRFRILGHVINRSPMLAIRDGKWKLLMNPDRSRLELYDLLADPSELNNLAEGHPTVIKHLSERLLAWKASLPKGTSGPEAGANAYPWPQEK